VNPDDIGSGAGPATERARAEVGVGVLAGVTDQRVFAAVGTGTFLALERFNGGGTCSAS